MVAQVCSLRIGVAALYHEIADDTVEEQAVEEVLSAQAHEVVAVHGCFVIKRHCDVSMRRVQGYFRARC